MRFLTYCCTRAFLLHSQCFRHGEQIEQQQPPSLGLDVVVDYSPFSICIPFSAVTPNLRLVHFVSLTSAYGGRRRSPAAGRTWLRCQRQPSTGVACCRAYGAVLSCAGRFKFTPARLLYLQRRLLLIRALPWFVSFVGWFGSSCRFPTFPAAATFIFCDATMVTGPPLCDADLPFCWHSGWMVRVTGVGIVLVGLCIHR